MDEIRYLQIEEVVVIHETVVKKFGGRFPIHDFTLLHSAVSRPQATFGGIDLYPTLFEKGAALIQSLILNHPFDDGNKRTAITSTSRFLFLNSYHLSLPKKESIQFTLDIDAKRRGFEDIASWLESHCKSK